MNSDGQKLMYLIEMGEMSVDEPEYRQMLARWKRELINTLRENAVNDTIPLEKSRASVVSDIKRSATHIARLVEKIK